MDYLKKSFSVNMSGTDTYRSNWEAVFGNPTESPSPCPDTVQEMVRQFHTVFGQPVVDTVQKTPDTDRLRLRLQLVAEEFFELLEACNLYVDCKEELRDAIECVDSCDIVGVADALGDLAYVIEGMCLELGLDSTAVLKEIHRSNMTKLGANGRPVYNAAGKVTKGPNYVAPNLKKVLDV